MAENVDCSYTDSSNVYHANTCAEGNACCTSGDVKVCSATPCNTLETYAFWLILAGVAVFIIILLIIIYCVCRYRKPLPGSEHRKSIFEETISQSRRPSYRRPSTRLHIPIFRIQSETPRQGGVTPITVRSGNGPRKESETTASKDSRWTILNNFNNRNNARTDSREEMLKSNHLLPAVQ